MADPIDPSILQEFNQREQRRAARPSSGDITGQFEERERRQTNIAAGQPADATGRPWWQDVLIGAARSGTRAYENVFRPITSHLPGYEQVNKFANAPQENLAQTAGGILPDVGIGYLTGGESLLPRLAAGALGGALTAPQQNQLGGAITGAVTGGAGSVLGPLSRISHANPVAGVLGGLGLTSGAYWALRDLGVPHDWIGRIAGIAAVAGASGKLPAGAVGALAEQIRETRPDIYRELSQRGGDLMRRGMESARQ